MNKKVNQTTLIISTVLCLLAVFSSSPVEAAVSQLGSAASTTNTNSLSFTVPAGSDRILLVVASDDDNVSAVASVTFGVTPLVQRATHTDGFAVDSVWTLSLGDSASSVSGNIIVVGTGGTPNNLSFIAGAAFSGVSQTDPISGVQMANATMTPSQDTLNIASTVGSLVFDVWDTFTNNFNPPNTVTPGANQTVIHNAGTVTLAAGFAYYRTSTRPGAANVPMNWTTSNGEALIHIGMSIDAAPTAASVGISGRVLTPKGRGVSNAFVFLTDTNGQNRIARTTTFGYYQFNDLEVGQTVVLSVLNKRYQFSPQTVTLNENITGFNFTALQR